MSIDRRSAQAALWVMFCLMCSAGAGCAHGVESPVEEIIGSQVSQPIVNGTVATTYEEAALVNMTSSICSGAIIAPYIALTAGHCVTGNSFSVKAPFAGGQTANGKSKWTTYVSQGNSVNPNTIDVAVIVLDQPINLSFYPPLATAPEADGTQAVNVGRIRNGQASYSQLFVGAAVTLEDATSSGFPLSYITNEIVQPGDSGGPVYVGSGANRRIVAVNSGAGGGTQILARVDLAYAKVQQLIAANGGSGGGNPPPPPPPPPPAGCSGTAESEPNDASTSANALDGTVCGALQSAQDVDWYTWTVAGPGVAYDMKLTAGGDADILVWKWANNAWNQIANTTSTQLTNTSNGPGQYVIAVRGGAAQSYSLTLTK